MHFTCNVNGQPTCSCICGLQYQSDTLHDAAKTGDLSSLQRLIDNGDNVNLQVFNCPLCCIATMPMSVCSWYTILPCACLSSSIHPIKLHVKLISVVHLMCWQAAFGCHLLLMFPGPQGTVIAARSIITPTHDIWPSA